MRMVKILRFVTDNGLGPELRCGLQGVSVCTLLHNTHAVKAALRPCDPRQASEAARNTWNSLRMVLT